MLQRQTSNKKRCVAQPTGFILKLRFNINSKQITSLNGANNIKL